MNHLFAAIFFLCSTAMASSPESVNIGPARYDVLIDRPTGKGPFPLLIIAPALKYTMTGDLFEKLAVGAANLGYMTVRFNWQFVTKSTTPSSGLEAEQEDLSRIIAHYSRAANVDGKNVVLATKSFGANVLIAGPHGAAKALLLLTPNCDATNTFRKRFKPLYDTDRPLHIVISTKDPYCEIGQIYEGLRDLGPNVTIHTLAGDHNFALKGPQSALNEAAAIQSSLNWLNQQR